MQTVRNAIVYRCSILCQLQCSNSFSNTQR